MLDIKHLKKDYQLKFFHVKGQSKCIYIREITHYIGSNKYRVIYEENLGEIKYLNELTENEFIEFIETLKIRETQKTKIKMEDSDIINETEQIDNINQLNKKLYSILNELYYDKISIEKAKAISNITQTILNVEKYRNSIVNLSGQKQMAG